MTESMCIYPMIATSFALLLFLQFGERFVPSVFYARKLCHAGQGALILCLDSRQWEARWYTYILSTSVISLTWGLLPKWVHQLRFGIPRDFGITSYLLIVSVWFYLQQPAVALAPLFFADPAGAIFGKWFANSWNFRWHSNKTVVGTFAVFAAGFSCIPEVPSLGPRVMVALLIALAEAYGGRTFDNAVIAVPALGSWLYYHGMRRLYFSVAVFDWATAILLIALRVHRLGSTFPAVQPPILFGTWERA